MNKKAWASWQKGGVLILLRRGGGWGGWCGAAVQGCREGLIKVEKLQLNPGGAGGICDITEEYRSRQKNKAKAGKCETVHCVRRRNPNSEAGIAPECRGGACPGSFGPTGGDLCLPSGHAFSFRTLFAPFFDCSHYFLSLPEPEC